eukprot:9338705-Lingulodinium_polyedra.AAC.1
MQLPFDSQDDEHLVWNRLESLVSFNQATEPPKLGRWFSWNTQAERRLPEYHAQKMLLEFHLEEPDPDDSGVPFDDLAASATARSQTKHFNALKAGGGGLKLCYMLMSSQLLQACKIMYIVSQACWTWYTHQVKTIKTPEQNLKYLVSMVSEGWATDQHLVDTIKHSLFKESSLQFMDIWPDDLSEVGRKLVTWTLDLMWCMLGHRAWSMASRHSLPPEAYAGLLSASP